MTKKANDFANKEVYYDFYDDYYAINQHFVDTQRRTFDDIINDETVTWEMFCHMFANISPYSELAYLLRIRSEKDPVKIKKFTPHERKIYLEWKKKHPIKKQEPTLDEQRENFNGWLEAMRATGRVIKK
jgi:hypothetical protein